MLLNIVEFDIRANVHVISTGIQSMCLQEFIHRFSVLHPPITQTVVPIHFEYDLYSLT